jgi:hypothetical protein
MAMVRTDGRRIARTAVVAFLCLFLSAAGTYAAPAVRCSSATDFQTDLRSQAWPNPANISTSPDTDSEAPALVVTSSGTLHVVWEEGAELYHSHRESSSWSTPSRVATGEQPSLAVGPDDAVHLAFVNEIGDVYNVYYTRWDGSDWAQPPRKVSETSSFSDSPDLAVAPDGHRHVVWTEDDQVYYGDSADGVIWAYGPFAEGSAPTVGTGGDGVVHSAWQVEESVNYEVYFSKLEEDSWSPPQNVSDSPGADSTAPDLSLQADGTPHLAWQEVISATAQVRYSYGPGWSQTVTLSDSDSGAYLPSLAVAPWGIRHAAWEDFSFPYYRIRYTYAYGPDSTWRPPTTIAQSPSPSQQLADVSLCNGSDGAVHAVWVATEGGKGEILYASNQLHHILLPLALRQGGG